MKNNTDICWKIRKSVHNVMKSVECIHKNFFLGLP